MNRILLVVLIFATHCTFAQDAEIPAEEIIYKDSVVDVQPEFPGGIETCYKYFEKHLVKPNVRGLVDKVMLSFVVEKDGSLSDIRVIHDAGFGTGDQVLSILETGPKWIPAIKDGKTVRVHHLLPIAILTDE